MAGWVYPPNRPHRLLVVQKFCSMSIPHCILCTSCQKMYMFNQGSIAQRRVKGIQSVWSTSTNDQARKMKLSLAMKCVCVCASDVLTTLLWWVCLSFCMFAQRITVNHFSIFFHRMSADARNNVKKAGQRRDQSMEPPRHYKLSSSLQKVFCLFCKYKPLRDATTPLETQRRASVTFTSDDAFAAPQSSSTARLRYACRTWWAGVVVILWFWNKNVLFACLV